MFSTVCKENKNIFERCNKMASLFWKKNTEIISQVLCSPLQSISVVNFQTHLLIKRIDFKKSKNRFKLANTLKIVEFVK